MPSRERRRRTTRSRADETAAQASGPGPNATQREPSEPAAADERAVAIGHARDPHDVAGMRGVHELAAPDVDPDVPEPAEEHEVAGRKLLIRNGRPIPELRRRVVWKRDTDLREHVAREARAIEAR